MRSGIGIIRKRKFNCTISGIEEIKILYEAEMYLLNFDEIEKN